MMKERSWGQSEAAGSKPTTRARDSLEASSTMMGPEVDSARLWAEEPCGMSMDRDSKISRVSRLTERRARWSLRQETTEEGPAGPRSMRTGPRGVGGALGSGRCGSEAGSMVFGRWLKTRKRPGGRVFFLSRQAMGVPSMTTTSKSKA